MSDKKEYSPAEVARKILGRVQEQLKKSESFLAKAKNTAHEIEPGQEPSIDTAECPEYLASADLSSNGEGEQSQSETPKKKKKSQSEGSEYEESESAESESEEEPESEESESEEESEESSYEFKKSESGMHTIEYKVLAKKEHKMKKMFGRPATSAAGGGTSAPPAPAPGTSIASQIGFGKGEDKKKDKKSEDPKKEDQPLCGAPMDKADEPKRPVFGVDHSEDKQKEQTDAQLKMTNNDRSGMPGAKRGSRKDQVKFNEEAKKLRQKYAEEGKIARSESVLKSATETKGIDLDQPRKSDKEKEQRKRPMEKCGDIEVGAKKAEKSNTCGIVKTEKSVGKLGKFLAKKEKMIH